MKIYTIFDYNIFAKREINRNYGNYYDDSHTDTHINDDYYNTFLTFCFWKVKKKSKKNENIDFHYGKCL